MMLTYQSGATLTTAGPLLVVLFICFLV
ncbi:hypothetical protein DPX39_050051500 [Trypanosoma brucei equiperdum]|uniref:Uncharacterized protein n=1 Tax=Trypanosoma brucei equiperdum TaxID=630700 RepID=A0A3L6L6V7_9TRYP|nr:hypothetical protein DPX39_050051500 [Trypanosoma brucei equiperdum]